MADARAWTLACLNLARASCERQEDGSKLGLDRALVREMENPQLPDPRWADFIMRLHKGEEQKSDEWEGECGMCHETGYKTSERNGIIYGTFCPCSRGKGLEAARKAKRAKRELRLMGAEERKRRLEQAGEGGEDEAVESWRERYNAKRAAEDDGDKGGEWWER